ncbi:MAG: hypothetical protein SFU98_14480 [Leptospiraceae bacterium]|nr:hypothetical protein [Leptospiraceae bacterium]
MQLLINNLLNPIYIQIFIFLVLLFNSKSLFPQEITNGFVMEKRFADKYKKLLESTLIFLDNLEPKLLVIDKDVYKEKSKFEEIFQFSYSPKKIRSWLNQRIKKVIIDKSNFYIAQYYNGQLSLDPTFFELSKLDQILVLIHEARHADGNFSHIKCPNVFPFLSIRNPEINLENEYACDSITNGCYGASAAFLYELISYGILNQELLIGKYNSELARIIRK